MKNKLTGLNYLWLAILSIITIGLELLQVLIEKLLGFPQIKSYTTYQIIFHWTCISIVWLVLGVLIVKFAKNKYNFNIFGNKSKLKFWQYFTIIICVVITVIQSYTSWNGFKPFIEFERLGILKFIFQYIYYIMESFLISLAIVFGQKAFEKWFKNEYIPYGGIILALTWGIGHILTKESIWIGIICALGSLLYGSSYLIVGKDYKKTLLLVFLMFVL